MSTTPHPGPRPRWRRRAVLAVLPFAATALPACDLLNREVTDPPAPQEADVRADAPRLPYSAPEGAGERALPFAAAFLAGIDREPVNAVCSALSAQVVLAMTALGAEGDTRAQMEEALGGDVEELAEFANTASGILAAVGETEREADDEDAPEPATASLVNALWAQEGMQFQDAFLEGLANYFGTGVFEGDFIEEGSREETRKRINAWVEDATNDLIEELVPKPALSDATRLVLVNALHLKAAWPDELSTGDDRFTTADGTEIEVPMLYSTVRGWYEDDLCEAAVLDTYGGQLALAVVRPREDVPAVLDAWAEGRGEGIGELLDGLEESSEEVELTLPAFDIEWDQKLGGLLQELGMTAAFNPGAEFGGITMDEELMISEVIQKAVITVDEKGMEAAAATMVAVDAAAAPGEEDKKKKLTLDVPFLFIAYETQMRCPLVHGWIGDPSQTR